MNCKSSIHSSPGYIQAFLYLPYSRYCVKKRKATKIPQKLRRKWIQKDRRKKWLGPSGQLEMGDEEQEEIKRASKVSGLGDREHVSALSRNKTPSGNLAPRET